MHERHRLRGDISLELGKLIYLHRLNLHSNLFRGSIPEQLSSMPPISTTYSLREQPCWRPPFVNLHALENSTIPAELEVLDSLYSIPPIARGSKEAPGK
ncbi:unnamed protein product [Linum trigynum]|uniref:Uncharacterized protein n=1 Tax=Linum trigynum TaxID=586398 RepID=A0AAV2GEN2_9ROSI